MRTLSDSELLTIGEEVALLPQQRRSLVLALRLLSAAFPDRAAALPTLPVGERDRLLMRWRTATWGQQIVSLIGCPRCNAPAELAFDMAELYTTSEGSGQGSLVWGTITAVFRSPNSQDI